MGVSSTEFESFEQQFLEIVGEFQSINVSYLYLSIYVGNHKSPLPTEHI